MPDNMWTTLKKPCNIGKKLLTHAGLCNIIFHVVDIGAGHTE